MRKSVSRLMMRHRHQVLAGLLASRGFGGSRKMARKRDRLNWVGIVTIAVYW
jgi:hypothetical protein